MNENYNPIGDSNQNVEPNLQNNDTYAYNSEDVVYSDDNSNNYVNRGSNAKKIVLIILGIIIIIIIILLLLKFCGKSGHLKDITIGDVPVMYVDQEYQVPVSAIGTGDRSQTQFEFSIVNPAVAELENKIQIGQDVEANIKALEVGTTKLEVVGQLGKERKTKTADVIVCDRFEVDGITDQTISVAVGEKAELGLNLGDNPKCYAALTFTFGNSAIARMVDNNKIEGLAKGKTTLTISDGSNEITYDIIVSDPDAVVKASSVSLNAKSVTVYVNKTKKMTATVKPSDTTNKKVKWSIANSSIATVSQTGVIKGKKVGTTKVTVTTLDGSNKTATATIKVVKATTPKPTPTPTPGPSNPVLVTGITLSPTSLSKNVGETGTITAGITPTNASNKTIKCSSSNTAIFTVTTNGNQCIVEGVKAGSATLTVTANDGSGKKATATITVKAPSSNTIQYKVRYYGNGATSGETASQTHTYGTSKTLRANGFVKTGYTFAGWATSSTGSVKYADKASVKNLTNKADATVKLYAIWKEKTQSNDGNVSCYFCGNSSQGGSYVWGVKPTSGNCVAMNRTEATCSYTKRTNTCKKVSVCTCSNGNVLNDKIDHDSCERGCKFLDYRFTVIADPIFKFVSVTSRTKTCSITSVITTCNSTNVGKVYISCS